MSVVPELPNDVESLKALVARLAAERDRLAVERDRAAAGSRTLISNKIDCVGDFS